MKARRWAVALAIVVGTVSNARAAAVPSALVDDSRSAGGVLAPSSLAKTLQAIQLAAGGPLRTILGRNSLRELRVSRFDRTTFWFSAGTPISPAFHDAVRKRHYQLHVVSGPVGSAIGVSIGVAPAKLRAAGDFAVVDDLIYTSSWARAFNPRQTRNGAFAYSTGVTQTPLMHGVEAGEHDTFGDGSQRLVFPLASGCRLEYVWNADPRKLDIAAEHLSAQMDLHRLGKFRVGIPKMHAEHLVSLRTLLGRHGLGAIFDARRRPFTGIDPAFDKALDDVFQYTELTVAEDGIALHAVTVGDTELAVSVPTATVNVDRSFWMRLFDDKGSTLYIGRFDKPVAW